MVPGLELYESNATVRRSYGAEQSSSLWRARRVQLLVPSVEELAGISDYTRMYSNEGHLGKGGCDGGHLMRVLVRDVVAYW
jgi:hypothetical protein